MAAQDSSTAIQASLSLLDREVWIVTAATASRRGGLCATWVSTVSLDPQRPTMLIGLAPNHFTTELIEQSGRFGLHLLRSAQATLALDFAIGSGRDRDKLAGLALRSESVAVPILGDCLAWLECSVFARYDAGDRWFYWADVVAGDRMENGSPLREKQLFAAATAEQKQKLIANLRHDIAVHEPLHAQWRTANLWQPRLS